MSETARKLDEPAAEREAVHPARVLVVEDETIFARAVATCLERAGHTCTLAGTLAEARARLSGSRDEPPDLVILDMRLPDGEGFELLGELTGGDENAPTVLVVTAYGDVSEVVRAMKAGSSDYLRKPVDLDELLVTVDKVMRSARLRSRLNYSQMRETRRRVGLELLGNSAPIREVRERIETIARISGDAQPVILILGETGTGKDLAARLLHRGSSRANRPFVHVDCTSLPRDIMEAELFGHVRGAFTGAHTSRAGLIEAAEDGTVFLDEVGELPPALQSKLLYVLERRHLRRVGSTREVPVQARFVAATNRNLSEMVARGEFRDDLYFRLNVLTVTMPPLRACRDDIPLLAHNFLDAAARSYGRPVPEVQLAAAGAMKAYTWPGNVRELRNVIERMVLLAGEGGVTAASLDLPSAAAARGAARPPEAASGAPATLAGAERDLIERALRATGGNTSEAARRLGVSRMALRYRIEKHGIRAGDFSPG